MFSSPTRLTNNASTPDAPTQNRVSATAFRMLAPRALNLEAAAADEANVTTSVAILPTTPSNVGAGAADEANVTTSAEMLPSTPLQPIVFSAPGAPQIPVNTSSDMFPAFASASLQNTMSHSAESPVHITELYSMRSAFRVISFLLPDNSASEVPSLLTLATSLSQPSDTNGYEPVAASQSDAALPSLGFSSSESFFGDLSSLGEASSSDLDL